MAEEQRYIGDIIGFAAVLLKMKRRHLRLIGTRFVCLKKS